MTEIWRPIAETQGQYEVSDHGNVRTLRGRGRRTIPANPTPRPIYVLVDQRGYSKVFLYSRGKRMPRWVHRLVLEAFAGPCPDSMEVRHLDGDPGNNSLSNLAWGTHAENMQDALRHGTHGMASKTHCIRGHEFTPENTRVSVRPNGRTKRECRECISSRAKTGGQVFVDC